MDGLRDFYLVGHSLGAYLAACYALEYPSHIRKLMMISPVGMSRHLAEGEEKDWKQLLNIENEPPQLAEQLAKFVFR